MISKITFNLDVLKSPAVVFFSMFLGIYLGIYHPEDASKLTPMGELYISFLQMSVIPILITAVISSFGKLIKNSKANNFLKRMFFVFVIVTVFTGSFSVIVGYLSFKFVGIEDSVKEVLSDSISQSKGAIDTVVSLSGELPEKRDDGIIAFLLNIIPNNVFSSLQDGVILQILFFSIVTGCVIGHTKGLEATQVVNYMHVMFCVFQKIISIAMYGLPFGIVGLLGGKIGSVSPDILFAMIKFVIVYYFIGIMVFIINFFVMWSASRVSFSDAIEGIKGPSIFSIATLNSFAAMAPAIDSLLRNFKYKEASVNLVTPLGITIGRYGNILFFGLAGVFIAEIYGVHLDVYNILFLIFLSCFAGIATAGATGIITLLMLSIVLKPLGLPAETAIIIFLAVDPIIDPMRTLIIVNTNMAVTSLTAERQSGRRSRFTDDLLVTTSSRDGKPKRYYSVYSNNL